MYRIPRGGSRDGQGGDQDGGRTAPGHGEPQAVIDYAIRRATISAFFRQAEGFFAGIGRAYVDAFVHYLVLKDPGHTAQGI